MAKTRSSGPGSPDPNPKRNWKDDAALTAAGFNLTNPPKMSDGFNQRVVDNQVNGQNKGSDHLAWHYYNTISELHFLVSYIGQALSQVRLFVGQTDASDPNNPVPVGPRHPARDLMRSFAGGDQGQSELMAKLGLHLTVTGDAVIIGPDVGSAQLFPFDDWRVYSTSEVSSRNGAIFLKDNLYREMAVPKGASAIRIYRSHPQYWADADSPVKSAFGVLGELELLDKHVRASAISRLAGAGILVLPEEITLPGGEVETEGLEADPFVKVLTEVMSLAIKNPDSAAALVPIILRGPAEFIGAIQRLDFSTGFDDRIPELRSTALRRLALGLDAPPEILLGSSESSSWSMWQISESVLRLHLKPLAHLICGALTTGWLIPQLQKLPLPAQTLEGIDNLGVYADFSQLRVQMDPSADAAALYASDLIDGPTYRHMLGFGDSDAPDAKELEFQMLIKLVSSNPQLAPWAIDALRTDFGIPFPEVDDALLVGQGGAAAPIPGVGTPKAPLAPGTAPMIPGQRSRDKQSEAPKTPKSPDANNNQTK